MTTIRAEEVRIPRHARAAVARHERVVVVNHERPAFVIMHPDDAAGPPAARRGRPLREALGLLAEAARPDPDFADDMEAVLADVGPVPDDPWAPSASGPNSPPPARTSGRTTGSSRRPP
jgi:hypothetical protein